MTYFAHSGTPGDKSDWQPLAGHLQAVAKLAATFARPFGMEKAATVLGLFHDLGKYNPTFQPRLEGADIRVDHSTAGAKVLVELARESMREGRARAEDVFMAEMLARTGVDRNASLAGSLQSSGMSPATHGRGSKLDLAGKCPEGLGSPATHGRGSKHHAFGDDQSLLGGRPLRTGVDRNLIESQQPIRAEVARYARAWIETGPRRWSDARRNVARYARAWIETATSTTARPTPRWSPAARAWIET